MAALHSPRTLPAPARSAALLPLLLIGLLLPGGLRAAPPDDAPSGADAPQWRAAAAAALHAPSARLSLQALPSARAGQTVTLDVVLAGVPRRVVLVPHSLRGPDFRVLVQGADGRLTPVAVPPAATWRGRIEGVPGGLVHAARVGGRWHAALSLPREDGTTERWAIMPLRDLVPWAPADVAVLAPGEDLVAGEATCAVEGGAAPPRPEPAPAAVERLMALSPEQVLRIEIACDADSEFYGLNGKSVPNTVADIEAVLNGSSLIYERDVQAALEIGTIIVRTAEPDPYSYTNPTTLLAEMLNEWKFNQTAVARDAAQLFTGKELDGTTIGISYRDGMCLTSSGYSLVQSRWSLVLDNRVQISTHELAHNLDSPHCDGDDYNCRIMCPSFGGCSGGIHSFGPVEETRLRAALPNQSCLDTATIQIEHATLPFSDLFTGGTLDATKWTAADRAIQTSGRLQLDHTKGSGSVIYLGTVRTLPIELVGNPTISYQVLPSNVLAGQQFQVDYFDTVRRKWFILNRITAPGGQPASYTVHTHTLGDSARGDLFAVRFTAYGSSGSSGAKWYLDSVSVTESLVDVPVSGPARALHLAVSPNPSAAASRITFEVASPRRVRFDVFDSRGAHVRTLVDGTFAAGRGEASWDGRDAGGCRVAAGVYLVRMRSGDEERSARVVRLK